MLYFVLSIIGAVVLSIVLAVILGGAGEDGESWKRLSNEKYLRAKYGRKYVRQLKKEGGYRSQYR